MKAPPFHAQVRRVELARQHLKAAATLIIEARELHRCDDTLRAALGARYRAISEEQNWISSILSGLIDAEARP